MGKPSLFLIPCSLEQANNFVKRLHRHHGPVVGHKFSLAVADASGVVHGVAIVSRPVARLLDDGKTLEVTRLCTDGTRNACSFLYGACWRAASALGYRRLITYTLPEEGGASLKASNWTCYGLAGGGSWNTKSRPRQDKHPLCKKFRWEMRLDPLPFDKADFGDGSIDELPLLSLIEGETSSDQEGV